MTHAATVRSPIAHAVDALVLFGLFTAGLVGFAHAYGTALYLLGGLVAIVLGLGIAYLSAALRWSALPPLLLVLTGYLVLGTPLVAPTHALAGIVPTSGSLRELLTAPALAWVSLFTVRPPAGTGQGLMAVSFLPALVLSVLAGSVAARSRHWGAALLFPTGYLALAIGYGTDRETFPLVQALVTGVGGLGWAAWRHEAQRLGTAASTVVGDGDGDGDGGVQGTLADPVIRRRLGRGLAVLGLAGVVTAAASPVLGVPDGEIRYAVRDRIVPPLDPEQYLNPLAGYRDHLKNHPADVLFTVTGASGGDRVRLATMDRHDGLVYNVAGGEDPESPSGAFLRTAPRVDLAEPDNRTRRIGITVQEYSGPWVPTVDRLQRITFTGPQSAGHAETLYFNSRTQNLLDSGGVRAGDAYTLRTSTPPEPSEAEQQKLVFAEIALPQNAPFDPLLTQQATEYTANATTDFERASALAGEIAARGFFSHGMDGEAPSLPGHGARRLTDMVSGAQPGAADPLPTQPGMTGDDEQYAALAGVMGRELGMPVRVVMGFDIPDGAGDGPVEITGDDVTAWIEVAFEGHGWIAFDPVPGEDQEPTVPRKEKKEPKAQVQQPPPPPVEPPEPPAASADREVDEGKQENEPFLQSARGFTLLAVSPFLLAALALGAIVAYKALRRRRRRRTGTALTRIGHGWDEVLDRARDLGVVLPARATRRELGAHLERVFPGAGTAGIAHGVDTAVFGPTLPSADDTDRDWQGVLAALAAMDSGESRWGRFRAAVSTRSLRRRDCRAGRRGPP